MAKSVLQTAPVQASEIIDLKIDSMAYDNSALARYKDFVIFVDRGAPGDKVKAEITTLRSNYARAKIIEIKESDPNYRIEPLCKLFKVCGGCQWQHLPYEKQLEQKDLLLKNLFLKLNLKEEVLKNTTSADTPWNYRNKVQYPVETPHWSVSRRLKAGYFEWHTRDLVNVKYCPIQHSLFDRIVETIRELATKYRIISYNGKTKQGWLKHICIRIGFNTNEALLTLVAVSEKFPHLKEFAKEIMNKHPELAGVCININKKTTNVIYGEKTIVLKGRGYIFEEINSLKFKISATSFFQTNTNQTIKLLDVIKNMIDGGNILDAYCGVGLISLSLAKYAKKIIGIEEIKQSVDDAIFSAEKNNIKNVFFIPGRVENKIKDVIEEEKPEIIILDPPRIGCNKKILENIINSNVKKIICVSCNPSTLVRDLEILNNDFQINLIQPIDMFPHSYHIECVALLER
ncbi:MAG: 23S rRNA (uracil(1939)-C(5))-methyltransferase RlmD [Candidatus Melainabacteria bacterium]|nr:23S rRNA (uracil(1939)-C(5))-methyltransferase RlmD [Candidatus Melainabacteria bacterium]